MPTEPRDDSLLTSPLRDLIVDGDEESEVEPEPEPPGEPGFPGEPGEEPPEPPADIPVSPSDLATIDLGSVVRFGSAVLRIGQIDADAQTVRFLKDGGDPEAFYTESELRILILLRPIPGTNDYDPWPRVVALNPKPAPPAEGAST